MILAYGNLSSTLEKKKITYKGKEKSPFSSCERVIKKISAGGGGGGGVKRICQHL